MQDKILTKGVTLVDFWAPWCGPCRAMMPVIEKVQQEIKQDFKVIKINVDEQDNTYYSELISQHDIRAIPTLIIYKNGDVFSRFNGVQTASKLIEEIKKALE